MKKSPVFRAIKQFLETTTLHGFKYLCSPYYVDRVGWFAWCCASACCGGVLCGVVWARFLHTPALLVSHNPLTTPLAQPMPLIGVCVSANKIVHTMARHLSINTTSVKWLPLVLGRILQDLAVSEDQLQLLDDLLTPHSLTLAELLHNYTPPCHELTTKCRWQNVMVDCNQLFNKEMTQWGVCCVMRPDELKDPRNSQIERLETNHRLVLALQCNSEHNVFGCRLFTRYHGEDGLEPAHLQAGYTYMTHLQFTSVQDSDSERLVDVNCVSAPHYSRQRCLIRCRERICGCSDPLIQTDISDTNIPPPCAISRLNCLTKLNSSECNCPPTCKKILTEVTLEPTPMTQPLVNSSIDPIYAGLNATSAIVLNLCVKIDLSKIYNRMPTETWLTLLSSLGGVFNMFLGVGLFSALEFLFFILVRLPIAIRRSTEITPLTEIYNNNHHPSTLGVHSTKHNMFG